MAHDIVASRNEDKKGLCTHYTLKDKRPGGKVIGIAVKTDAGGFKFYPLLGTGLTMKSAKKMKLLKIAIRKDIRR